MKKAAAVVCMILMFAAGILLGAAAARYSPEAADVPITASAGQDPLETFRTEREQLRQMQTAQLKELIYGDGAEDAIAAEAKRRLLELMEWQEQETTIEGVLSLREFEDAVATVHRDSVSVLVRGESLNQQQTAIILELVMRETGISGGNVKIIPIN